MRMPSRLRLVSDHWCWLLQTWIDHAGCGDRHLCQQLRQHELRCICSPFASTNRRRTGCMRMPSRLRLVSDHWCWLLQAWIDHICSRRSDVPR
jgi:hypothetical protein